jgi:hypothetical protein
MRRLFAIPLLAFGLPAAADAAPAPQESWGKPGVALTQYRQDALECGLLGHYTDISKTEDAQALVHASRQLETVTNGASAPSVTGASGTGPASTDSVDQMVGYAAQQQHIVEAARPEQRFRNIKKTLVAKDEQCLIQRGYAKFRLTGEQRRRLRKLKAGSDERRSYLYSLARDPAILRSQAVAPNP